MTPGLFYVMSEETPKKAKYTISDEERQRRSDRARELTKRRDPVTGKPVFGGNHAKITGRPRKKRPTEIWNDKIEKHAEEIWSALYKAMNSNKELISLQAVKQIVEIANKETDVTLREEKNIENTSTEELINLVSTRLARLAESGKLPFDFDADAEEIIDGPEQLEAGPDEDEPEGSSGTGATDAGSGTSAFARRPPKR